MVAAEAKSKAHILIVDDDALVRRMIRQALLQDKYGAVSEAADGAAALGKLEKKGYDIVITDVRMPAKGGIELLIEVKRRFPQTAVIVMTGYGDVHTPDEARRLGADEYITKPISAQEIQVIVERVRLRQWLAKKQTRRSGEGSLD